MPLEIVDVPVTGLKKSATFKTLSITQSDDGKLSLDCTYKIDMIDAAGVTVTSLDDIRFGFSQEQLMTNPNFPATYGIVRELIRAGLAAQEPDLVKTV